ncbi:MAG: PIN domain-containing protein [bacterium]
MKDRFFLDTNIIIYSFDVTDRDKAQRAKQLISEALNSKNGCIGTQAIQEFLNVATRKFERPLSIQDCRIYLQKVLFPLCEVYPDSDLYELGLDIQSETGYSFYDSMIIAAAKKANCSIIYSEDLQDGHRIQRVKIVNPFKSRSPS